MGRRDSEAPASSVVMVLGRPPHGGGGSAPASSVVMVLGRPPHGSAPADESSFDANVVIILGALFFALLFAIGLNSLAQCVLRHGGGRGVPAGGASSAGALGGGGIKRRALRSLPVDVYGVGEDIDDVCAICLGEFVDGEKVRVLPRCGHGFHVLCVDAWLVSHGSCPTCRCPVVVDGDQLSKVAGAGDGDGHSTIAVVIS